MPNKLKIPLKCMHDAIALFLRLFKILRPYFFQGQTFHLSNSKVPQVHPFTVKSSLNKVDYYC